MKNASRAKVRGGTLEKSARTRARPWRRCAVSASTLAFRERDIGIAIRDPRAGVFRGTLGGKWVAKGESCCVPGKSRTRVSDARTAADGETSTSTRLRPMIGRIKMIS